MVEVQEEQEKKVRCMLIGAPQNTLSELNGLVYTLGLEVADSIVLNRMDIQPAYGMGSGKAQELCAHAKAIDADCIIMDFELDPTKQRNWEKLADMPVFDRQEVILRIFASRALTREAVLQVELARLEYSLPRLSHMYGDLARQRGGNYGAKGAGETQLELDRRGVRERIFKLKKELDKVVQDRSIQRKRRQKNNVKTVALCGYTNAGKSSLLNALTSSEAFVEDKLFATLDPLTRKLYLKNPDYDKPESYESFENSNSNAAGTGANTVSKGREILLTDTVGFISNLPHSLVNAFRSTLEEASYADLLLIVLDASDPFVFRHYETICNVLEEIDADKNKSIIVLNKTDNFVQSADDDSGSDASDEFHMARLEKEFPDSIKVSAKTGAGLEELKARLWAELLY